MFRAADVPAQGASRATARMEAVAGANDRMHGSPSNARRRFRLRSLPACRWTDGFPIRAWTVWWRSKSAALRLEFLDPSLQLLDALE